MPGLIRFLRGGTVTRLYLEDRRIRCTDSAKCSLVCYFLKRLYNDEVLIRRHDDVLILSAFIEDCLNDVQRKGCSTESIDLCREWGEHPFLNSLFVLKCWIADAAVIRW